MKKQYVSLFTGLLFFSACATGKKAVTVAAGNNASTANDGKLWASLYQQRAAEYQALCFQAYNLAKLRLDEALQHKGSRPLAVITDVDETVLDNSPYDAERAIHNQDFDLAAWKRWTAKAQADTVPGAPAFLKYAAAKGVTIFYVTNRDEDERTGTTRNLRLYNLPFADDVHILLKNGSSSKEARRRHVAENFDIVLLCGDNLPDFDARYDNKPAEASRTAATRQLMQQFGSRYIVIPNGAYGDWENAWFSFGKLTPAQKDSVIRAKVKLDKQ